MPAEEIVLVDQLTGREVPGLEVSIENERLLRREAEHRLANMLALFRALVSLASQSSSGTEELTLALMDRIDALAIAQHVEITSDDGAPDLESLLIQAVRPFLSDASEAIVSGPHYELSTDEWIVLRLVILELVTNSVKYGALGASNRILRVSWRQQAEHWLIDWEELGYSPKAPGTSSGTGHLIIRDLLASRLAGWLSTDLREDGYFARLTLPASSGEATAEADASVLAVAALYEQTSDVSHRRSVLIAEDDPIIALDLEQQLKSLGYSNLRAVSSVVQLRAELKKTQPGLVLLDLNLADGSTVGIAKSLIAEKHDVICITGQGCDQVRQLPSYLPILQKPMQGAALAEIIKRLDGRAAERGCHNMPPV